MLGKRLGVFAWAQILLQIRESSMCPHVAQNDNFHLICALCPLPEFEKIDFFFFMLYYKCDYKNFESMKRGIDLKDKIAKACFYVSFVPYALLYFFSLRAYSSGWNFLFSRTVGLEAVKSTFSCYLVLFSVVFIGCSVYQLFYGIRKIAEKNYFIAAIIPTAITILFFIYCLLPF